MRYTMYLNDLCSETCGKLFVKMTAKSKLLLSRPKMAHMVKIPFIVFPFARLISSGQASHLDMICP